MKKYNLNTQWVSKLNEQELEELTNYLMTLSIKESLTFFLKVIDEEYTLCDDTIVNKKAEVFLSDKKFARLRELYLAAVDWDGHLLNKDICDVTDEQWKELQSKYSS